MVLHAEDVPGYRYQMWNTTTVPKATTLSSLVDQVAEAIDRAGETGLKNLVINCHGSHGYLHIGKGIGYSDLGAFNRLRQKGDLGTIWIVACEVSKGKYYPYACPVENANGPFFCGELARNAGCDVIAADELQHVDWFFEHLYHPFGYIDDYEGQAYRYSAGGGERKIASV